MKIVLVPCGRTEWQDEGRLLGRVELPLSPRGERECAEWAKQLATLNVNRILHGPDDLATRTAAVLARQLSVATRQLDELCEVDLGLWAGLTEAQLKRRFATAFRELRDAPLNVSPPGGESFSAAAERVRNCLCRQFRKNGASAIAVVLRPLAFALARCVLADADPAELWESAGKVNGPLVIECDAPPAA